MHALVLLCINQHTTFEVPSLIHWFRTHDWEPECKKRVTQP